MKLTSPLFRSLPVAPLDIIGDVHGEFETLMRLLHYLGYDDQGRHPQGRKLVFVGDLCDRGPDSPAVLQWVLQAMTAEHAFAVLGNHELNLLMHDPKDGSGWYFDHRDQDEQRYAPWQHFPASQRSALHDALAEWPLMLQRDDVRVVHAAWLPESLQQIARANDMSVIEQYHYWESEFEHQFQQSEWYGYYQDEQQRQHEMEDEQAIMTFQPGTAHYDLLRSRSNPIRVITSGIETLTSAPFYAGGRWRFTVRMPWWQPYSEKPVVVIGHYWRHWYNNPLPVHRQGLFHEPATQWLGAAQRVFCIDFSAGARWRERHQGIALSQTQFHLAALRWPEQVIVLDNGLYTPTTYG